MTDSMSELPEFAAEWMAQWKLAAKELPRIRDDELRRMGQSDLSEDASVWEQNSVAWSGLVIQQRWFMRQRLLQLLAEDPKTDGDSKASSVGG